MEDSWVESYYDALGFFYWEPQHLGRKKYVDSRFNTFAKVQDHLRLMEVTLNHQIKQFLLLAPGSLRNRLFESAFDRPISGEFIMAGCDVDRKYGLNNATQPDLLFTTDDKTVSLEMKMGGTKSSVTQVLKYALLALAVEQLDGLKRQHFLLFLGIGGFSSLWQKGLASVDDLRRVLEAEKLTFLDGRPKRFQERKSRYFEIVSSLSIGFISYGSLANILETEIKAPDGSAGAQVYRNLVGGIVAELRSRGLAS